MILTLEDFFEEAFSFVQEPRANQRRHRLVDILVIAFCSVICGAEGWDEIAWFGGEKEDWFQSFLELPFGIPSASTFERVISSICPDEFCESLQWVTQALHAGRVKASKETGQREQVAIDGKTLRKSFDTSSGIRALHTVNAYACELGACIGQVTVSEKSNEITAIPRLLDILELRGKVVSLDAMGTQKNIAKAIRSKKADYILALKKNHGDLFQAVEELFSEVEDITSLGENVAISTTEKGHGRIERRDVAAVPFRRLWASTNEWPDLATFVAVDSVREINGVASKDRRFYITSLPPVPSLAAKTIRNHWQVENKLHWTLDVTFREDCSRVRKDHGAKNLSILRKMTLNLLKSDKKQKISIKRKRLKAAMNKDYLESLFDFI